LMAAQAAGATVPLSQCDTDATTCPPEKPLGACCDLEANTCDITVPATTTPACIGSALITSACCPAPSADSTNAAAKPGASPAPNVTQQAPAGDAGAATPNGQPTASPTPDGSQQVNPAGTPTTTAGQPAGPAPSPTPAGPQQVDTAGAPPTNAAVGQP
jgi:hypothetical protein